MTERLSDADLDHLASNLNRPLMVRAAEEIRALRAQQAPTTDEPAAWLVTYGQHLVELRALVDKAQAERVASAWDVEAVPLYRHPAPATDDPTPRVLAVLNDWETTEPEDGWGTLADEIRAALTQGGGDRG